MKYMQLILGVFGILSLAGMPSDTKYYRNESLFEVFRQCDCAQLENALKGVAHQDSKENLVKVALLHIPNCKGNLEEMLTVLNNVINIVHMLSREIEKSSDDKFLTLLGNHPRVLEILYEKMDAQRHLDQKTKVTLLNYFFYKLHSNYKLYSDAQNVKYFQDMHPNNIDLNRVITTMVYRDPDLFSKEAYSQSQSYLAEACTPSASNASDKEYASARNSFACKEMVRMYTKMREIYSMWPHKG